MEETATEWLHIAARWTHVLAGIMWIGQTYLFNWFEKHGPLDRSPDAGDHVAGQLWMVHGGGFYFLEKQKEPQLKPQVLHWFKYESLVSWATGFILLMMVYYLGGALTDETVSSLTHGQAVHFALAVLILGWVVYDLVVRFTPVGKNDLLAICVFFPAIVGVIYLLTHTLSGRAAYIHVGALFGTIMVSNVWMRILPGQRKMMAAKNAGQPPDMRHGASGKQRSKHNTYMSVPLVFTMISNHFPVATYGSPYNWVVLSALVGVGFIAAHFIRNH